MLSEVMSILEKNNSKLLYLTEFGSHLYGLNTPASDRDYYAIFIPSVENQILYPYKEIKHKFTISTKVDQHLKNTEHDVDIKFISLQAFMHGLNNTEVECCDLAFSYTNAAAIVYCEPAFNQVHTFLDKYIDVSNMYAFYGYGLNQIKKYGIKGSTLSIYKFILDYIDTIEIDINTTRLSDLLFKHKLFDKIKLLVDIELSDKIKIEYKTINCNDSIHMYEQLVLFGQKHQTNILVKEFKDRITKLYDRYGSRAKEAAENKNIDWKAAMHGLRAVYEYTKLLTDGMYTFPFKDDVRDMFMKIKTGGYTWSEYVNIFNKYETNMRNIYDEVEASSLTINKRDSELLITDIYDMI